MSFDIGSAVQSVADEMGSENTEVVDSTEPVEEEVVEDVVEDVEETTEETPEDETVEEETVDEDEEVEEDLVAAPQSWKKEMREHFEKLDPEVKDYINLREKQMLEGLGQYQETSKIGKEMNEALAPYREVLKSQGISEPQMVRSLMNAHYQLSTAQPEQKAQLIKQIADSYGVSLEGEQNSDPVIQSLQEKINGMERYLTTAQQREREAEATRIESEVTEFAKTHEFLDEVAGDIVPFINSGLSLEDAYEKALWANPVTRQKAIDKQAADAVEKAERKAKQEREKARKAKSANVKSRDTNRTPTEPLGTMEDTMRETLSEIQNR